MAVPSLLVISFTFQIQIRRIMFERHKSVVWQDLTPRISGFVILLSPLKQVQLSHILNVSTYWLGKDLVVWHYYALWHDGFEQRIGGITWKQNMSLYLSTLKMTFTCCKWTSMYRGWRLDLRQHGLKNGFLSVKSYWLGRWYYLTWRHLEPVLLS